MTQFEDVLETILEEYARRDSEGEFDTWEETDAFVKKKAEVLLAYVKEEPVSEDLEKASKKWLAPQLDKSYANYGEVKMMELTHFDGYAMLDAIEFGAQWQKEQDSIVSEDLEAELDKYIKDNFTIDKEQLDRFGIEEKDYMYSMDKSDMEKMVRYFTGNYKIPVSDDLEEAMQHNAPDNIGIDDLLVWRNGFITGAQWQKDQNK